MLSVSLGKGARHRIRYGLGLRCRIGHRLLHLRLCFLLDWLYGSLGSWLDRFGMFGLPLAPQCGRLLLHALMRTLQDLAARSLARVGVRRHAYQSPGFVQFHSRHVVGKRRLQARADLDPVDAALFIGARVGTHEGHQNLIHRGLRITRTIQRGNRPHRHAVTHEEGLIQVVVSRIERKLDRTCGGSLDGRLGGLHRLLRCGRLGRARRRFAHGRHVGGLSRRLLSCGLCRRHSARYGSLGARHGTAFGSICRGNHTAVLGGSVNHRRNLLGLRDVLDHRRGRAILQPHFIELGRDLARFGEFNNQRELSGVHRLLSLELNRVGFLLK